MKNSLIKYYSWIISGTQRVKIIKQLTKPKTPKQISETTHLKFSNVSDSLNALVNRKIVKCLNPENHIGRLYELTAVGREIKDLLMQN